MAMLKSIATTFFSATCQRRCDVVSANRILSPHAVGKPVNHFNRQQQQQKWFSSHESTENSINNSISNLKKMLKPFYLKCHPDVQTSSLAKRVNLTAIQNLNAYVDLIQQTSSLSPQRPLRTVEWPKQPIMIEFLMTTASSPQDSSIATRRRIELAMPSYKLQQALSIYSTEQEYNSAVAALTRIARNQIQNVLGIAGLPIDTSLDEIEEENIDELWEKELEFLEQDKHGSPSSSSFTTPTRFANDLQRPIIHGRYERSRRKFVRSINHKKLEQIYQEAYRDAEIDLQTTGWIGDSPKRRQTYVDGIVSRVRVDPSIDLLDQLPTLRRLSLVLHDNFDELEMEDMGKMWDDIVLILLPARSFNTSGSALNKRKRKMKESGYHFTFAENARVTVHVPIDFGPEELVQELQGNLRDFYRLTKMANEGVFHDMMPSWAKE